MKLYMMDLGILYKEVTWYKTSLLALNTNLKFLLSTSMVNLN